MKRLLLPAGLFAVLTVVSGCTAPEARVPLPPLPEENPPPFRYSELLERARYQAAGATEAFYRNRWGELEEFAKGLEQTARFLPKAEAVPARRRENLAILSADLGKESARLREAARGQDSKACNDAMTRVNATVRELRPDD
jgi:hypothetical protein